MNLSLNTSTRPFSAISLHYLQGNWMHHVFCQILESWSFGAPWSSMTIHLQAWFSHEGASHWCHITWLKYVWLTIPPWVGAGSHLEVRTILGWRSAPLDLQKSRKHWWWSAKQTLATRCGQFHHCIKVAKLEILCASLFVWMPLSSWDSSSLTLWHFFDRHSTRYYKLQIWCLSSYILTLKCLKVCSHNTT